MVVHGTAQIAILSVLLASCLAFLLYMLLKNAVTVTRSRRMDTQYFRRKATFEVVDGRIVVMDPNAPRVITLDPWLEVIWTAADGQRTVAAFIEELKGQYPDPPKELPAQTKRFIATLCHEHILELSPRQEDLPSCLRLPVAEQDREQS